MENIYIVKSNDNIYDIANKFNTTVGILKALNNLQSNILQVGQILKLPTSQVEQSIPSDYIIYSVQKGDNLYNIAKKYNLTLDELVNFNEQGTTLLNIGQELLIPIKFKSNITNNNFNNNENNNYINYIIKPGDTLYNIAKRYNVSVDDIKNNNNFTSNMLKIGDIIIIPIKEKVKTYVVRTNDTLNNIANKFNTTVDELMKLNNLETDDVVIGQILLVP